MPDGTIQDYYYNYYGELMLNVTESGGQKWATFTEYDSAGRPILVAQPSAVSLPSSLSTIEGYDDLLHAVSGNYQYLNDSSGLITAYTYTTTSGTATSSTAGSIFGFLSDIYIRDGETGTNVHQEHMTYFAEGPDPIAADTVYGNADGTDARTTSYSYVLYTGTSQIEETTVTYPTISSGQNGPGTADTNSTYFDTYGRPTETVDGDGHVNLTSYDDDTDAVTQTTIDNVALNLVTNYQIDLLGRTTKITSPNGNVTYIVYNDANHEVRTYPGFNGTTTTGPIQVMRTYFPAANSGNLFYSETLTTSATPHLTGGVPDGTETISASNLQSLSRNFYNGGRQLIWSDKYFYFGGLTYSQTVSLSSGVPADIGTSGTDYYRTTFGYDEAGRQNEVIAPTGTINITVFDGLGRVISLWTGTDASHSGDDWTPSTNTGNMMKTQDDFYDGGGVGDSNLTQVTMHVDTSSSDDRVIDYLYDWRDRLVLQKEGVQSSEDSTTHRPILYFHYDNLDEVTESDQYDGDGVSLSGWSYTAGVPNAPSSSLLRAKTTDSYDDQGRVYESKVYNVDQSSGSVGSNLTTDDFYDHRGDLIAVFAPGGLAAKDVYDGADRLSAEYTTDGGAVNNSNTQQKDWTHATSVSSDVVFSQTEFTYDGDDNVILTVTRDRFDDDATSSTGGLGSPSSGIGARVYYVADYYDAADRPTDEVDVGTNGGSSYTRPSSVPSRSDTVLVTHTAYDAAGNAYEVIDPRNILTEYFFDMLSRVTGETDNSDGGSPASGSAGTGYTYDGDNNIVTLTAEDVSPNQTTAYVRGVGGTSGTNLFSNDLIAKVEYPTKSGASAGQPDTTSAGSVSYSYDLLGEPLTATDQNGNVHAYSYDVLRRLKLDAVTTLGSGVDGSIRALGYSFNALGLPYQQTSYSDSSASTLANQVQEAYNGYGQLTAMYQAHSGAVNTSTTPVMQYTYSQPSGANYSRPSSMTYPNGRVEDFVYNSGIDTNISRVSGISDDAGTGAGSVESYKYLGLDTIVQRTDGNGIALTYIKQSGESNGDAGDQYIGLNRFNDVVDQRWIPTSSPSTPTDRFQYGFDRDGNVLSKNNLVNSSFSELYHANSSASGDNNSAYDKLNRLAGFRRGTLSASGNNGSGALDTVTTLNTLTNSQQSFTLDAVGNQTSVTTDGTSTSRTVNSGNQITALGSSSLAYDNNGNTTTDDQGHTLVYDAWNRQVTAKSGGTTLVSYTYDANFNRISRTASSTTTDFYLSSAGQIIEEKQGSTVSNQYVWGLGYINDLILRDDNSTSGSYGKSSSGLGRRIYVQQDANFNATAITDTSGNVLERFVYTSYGVATVLSSSWTTTSDSYAWVIRYQGSRFDSVTNEDHMGLRDLGLDSFTWDEADPTGWLYVNGANLYRFEISNPVIGLDPTGLQDAALNNPATDALLAAAAAAARAAAAAAAAGPEAWPFAAGIAAFAAGAWWAAQPGAQAPGGRIMGSTEPAVAYAEDFANAQQSIKNARDATKNNQSSNDSSGQGQQQDPQNQRPRDDKQNESNDQKKDECPTEDHHLLPRKFKDEFKKRGLDIEDYKIKLPKDRHRLKPDGIHTGPFEESWNGQWQKFFEDNPNASVEDILIQLGKMRSQFGI